MKVLSSFILLLLALSSTAQIFDPVSWRKSHRQISDDQFELVYSATIEDGWYVYSQFLESDDGPIATELTFESGAHFELAGNSTEDSLYRKEEFDSVFEMQLAKFTKEMTVRQRVKIKDFSKPIAGYLTFMTCDGRQCLAPTDIDFEFVIHEPITEATPKVNPNPKAETPVVIPDPIEPNPDPVDSINETKAPDAVEIVDSINNDLFGISEVSAAEESCEGVSSVYDQSTKTLGGIFLLGLLGGLLALLTPCVFPLIPLTVSFFTKGAENQKKGFRDAILYGVFILLVYVLLSVPFHLLDSINPDILNEISTNVYLNIGFFLVFLFFAFSFFGYYEITMPSSLTNRVSSAEGAGGIIGIFFMALTLSLVSFSCTGPILGSLLAGALTSDGGAWQLTAGMSGFGLALALPFALFAMFPGWMTKLPKSGGWLNTVKVVLGFLELALALKFLSNADLVQHWGIVRYELFMSIWIIVAALIALYLFGVIRFSGDSKDAKIGNGQKIVGLGSVALTVYLGFGLIYNSETQSFNSLKLLSGLAPPAGYSWIYPSECPNGLNCFKDLDSGLAYAQKENKPVLLDFTGYACVNCRKMEEHVWSDPRIFNLIDQEYVLISLYVDDKEDLPEEEKIEVDRIQGGKRKLRNYGHKWSHFQTKYFKANSQPFYVALDPTGTQMLNNPVGYTPDIGEYEAFLRCGLEKGNVALN